MKKGKAKAEYVVVDGRDISTLDAARVDAEDRMYDGDDRELYIAKVVYRVVQGKPELKEVK